MTIESFQGKDKFKMEPVGLRKAIFEFAHYYYLTDCYNSNRVSFEKVTKNTLYFIFSALQVANGIEIKKLERAYPARFDALKRFERFMIENHKQLPDEFFYQWGYVFDFEKKCVIDIVKFPNYFTKQIKKIING